jgi:hypothetical protein
MEGLRGGPEKIGRACTCRRRVAVWRSPVLGHGLTLATEAVRGYLPAGYPSEEDRGSPYFAASAVSRFVSLRDCSVSVSSAVSQ